MVNNAFQAAVNRLLTLACQFEPTVTAMRRCSRVPSSRLKSASCAASVFSEDFRHITLRGEQGRSDRLLRAAVTAFCSLTRPTRRDARQLAHLALPLCSRASVGARRYVAAVLSDLPDAPRDLVAMLANDQLDIAAPLLKRSPLLADLDLLAIIARHGLGHARVIARRRDLNPVIASLIKALANSEAATQSGSPDETFAVGRRFPTETPSRADAVRDRLRSMMQAADNHALLHQPVQASHRDPKDELDRIRRAMASRFSASGHATTPHASGRLFGAATLDEIVPAMKSLAIPEDKALLIACSAFPERFSDVSAVADFVHAYRHAAPPARRPSSDRASNIVKLSQRA